MTPYTLTLAVVLIVFSIGFYCLISKTNLIRIVIGIEVMAKAVTLNFVYVANHIGDTALGQAMVITIILIEVIVAAVALSLVVGSYRHTGSLTIEALRRLRG
ncbi:MAG: hypothetical protein DRO11_04270 [Methanobacteriota archaeon]|nr:MAG: hypothetical protein DRO11_04270 [Euryarchaeota archaeon]